MYILWITGKEKPQGAIIKGNWIIPLLHKAHKLGLNGNVAKLDKKRELLKTYRRINGRIRGFDV